MKQVSLTVNSKLANLLHAKLPTLDDKHWVTYREFRGIVPNMPFMETQIRNYFNELGKRNTAQKRKKKGLPRS